MLLPSHRSRKKTVGAALLFAAPLLLAGCGGGGKNASPVAQSTRSTSLTLSLTWPQKPSGVGRAFPVAANSLTISVTDSANNAQTQTLTRPPAGSANTTVTASFTNLANGRATVIASAFASGDGSGPILSQAVDAVVLQTGKQASANLVFPSPIASIVLAPADFSLVLGGTGKITATAIDDRDQTFTPVGIWASSNPAAVSVDANGNVSGVAGGTSVITFTDATFGKTAQTTVTVTLLTITQIVVTPQNPVLLPGATLLLAVSGQDDAGGVVQSPAGTWASSNPAVATVDASGNVTAVRGGSAIISFTDAVFGVTGATTVAVRSITQIALAPQNPTVAPGGTIVLSATGRDAGGVVQNTPPGVWASSDTTTATVSATGVVTGIRPGVVQITFTDSVYGVSATTSVTVRGGDAEVIIQ